MDAGDHGYKAPTAKTEKGLKTEYEGPEEDVKGSVSLSAAGKRKMDSEEKDATEREQEKGSMSLDMATQVNKPTATEREGVTSYGKKMKMSKGDTKDDHGYKVELDQERDYDLWEQEIEVEGGAPSDTGSSDSQNYRSRRADDYGEESDDDGEESDDDGEESDDSQNSGSDADGEESDDSQNSGSDHDGDE